MGEKKVVKVRLSQDVWEELTSYYPAANNDAELVRMAVNDGLIAKQALADKIELEISAFNIDVEPENDTDSDTDADASDEE